MKTKEWGPGEESGPKGRADLGQITWSSMSSPLQVCAPVGAGRQEGETPCRCWGLDLHQMLSEPAADPGGIPEYKI